MPVSDATSPAVANTSCHDASLHSNDQLALAGLVDGSRCTGRPNARVMRIARADSPPLCAIARKLGKRATKAARSLGSASSIALSRLPSRRQAA